MRVYQTLSRFRCDALQAAILGDNVEHPAEFAQARSGVPTTLRPFHRCGPGALGHGVRCHELLGYERWSSRQRLKLLSRGGKQRRTLLPATNDFQPVRDRRRTCFPELGAVSRHGRQNRSPIQVRNQRLECPLADVPLQNTKRDALAVILAGNRSPRIGSVLEMSGEERKGSIVMGGLPCSRIYTLAGSLVGAGLRLRR